MNVRAKVLAAACFISLSANAAPASDPMGQKHSIHVEVRGLHNDRGQVLCALFAAAAAFPNQPEQAVAHVRSPIAGGRATCEFVDVTQGIYAVSVIHDENSNGKLDRNLLGIPSEGVGASNDARGSFGPPKFQAASFQFDGGELNLNITVDYLM